MSDGKSRGAGRTRIFATVVYPESAPENWQDILVSCVVPAFISPLHDRDINPTGESKKSHFHVMLMFDSVKTIEQAKDIFDLIGGVGCERVNSVRGYARYLCHLDNPDKAQYSVEDVRCLAGADYLDVIGLPIDRYKAIGEMIDFCYENRIFVYADLLMYARRERFDWFRILCDSGTVVMREYLKSFYWRLHNLGSEDA